MSEEDCGRKPAALFCFVIWGGICISIMHDALMSITGLMVPVVPAMYPVYEVIAELVRLIAGIVPGIVLVCVMMLGIAAIRTLRAGWKARKARRAAI